MKFRSVYVTCTRPVFLRICGATVSSEIRFHKPAVTFEGIVMLTTCCPGWSFNLCWHWGMWLWGQQPALEPWPSMSCYTVPRKWCIQVNELNMCSTIKPLEIVYFSRYLNLFNIINTATHFLHNLICNITLVYFLSLLLLRFVFCPLESFCMRIIIFLQKLMPLDTLGNFTYFISLSLFLWGWAGDIPMYRDLRSIVRPWDEL